MSTNGLEPHEHVVFTEFEAGDGILVDLNTKKYFQLNETATIVWRGLEKSRTLGEIGRRLEPTFLVKQVGQGFFTHLCSPLGGREPRSQARRPP